MAGPVAARPSPVRELLMRTSPRVTRFIARHWGDSFPLYYVSEYPKSGGTWFGRMLADYLQLPLPQRPLMPVAMSAILHNHWPHDPRLSRVTHVVRDGRDVMVSLYFHRMRVIRTRSDLAARRFAERYRKLFGADHDPDDSRRWLPRFIEDEFRRPGQCPQNWSDFVRGWSLADPARATTVRYEALLADGPAALGGVVRWLTGAEPDAWRLRTAVDKFSFERVAGRARGVEDRSQFVRKGIAGDWRNHFSREAAQLFDRLAGDALVALGYEADRGWPERYAYPG